MFYRLLVLAVLTVVMSACGDSSSSSNQGTQADRSSSPGRKETEKLKATEGLGYDSAAVRKNVDKALDINDQRIQQLDKNIESSTSKPR